MGYRSTIVVMHDYLSNIEAAPGRFVREMHRAIQQHPVRDRIEHWGSFMGGQVISVEHADVVELIAVAGYGGVQVEGSYRTGDVPKTDEEVVELLKRAAAKYGYYLSTRIKGAHR